MKHKKLTLELKIPKEDYYQLCQDAEQELRTVENEVVYRIKKSVTKLRDQDRITQAE